MHKKPWERVTNIFLHLSAEIFIPFKRMLVENSIHVQFISDYTNH